MRTDRLERMIGIVFRTGIALSSGCLALGLVVLLATGTGELSTRLLDAGLVVLLATPVTRVAVSVVEYIVDRDWTFTALTMIVLAELAASVFAAMLG
jgi:uncharacterized membrane protein